MVKHIKINIICHIKEESYQKMIISLEHFQWSTSQNQTPCHGKKYLTKKGKDTKGLLIGMEKVKQYLFLDDRLLYI